MQRETRQPKVVCEYCSVRNAGLRLIDHAFFSIIGHGMASLSLCPLDKNKPPLAANPAILTVHVTFVSYIRVAQRWVLYSGKEFEQEIEGPYYQEFETILTPQ